MQSDRFLLHFLFTPFAKPDPMNTTVPTSPRLRRTRGAALLAAAALVATLLSAAGGPSAAFADGGTATLSGTVTGSASVPVDVADVQVVITSADGSYFDSTSTDENGSYELDSIPAGSYTLDFTPAQGSNFVPEWWNGKSSQSDATYFPVADGQALAGFDAQLVAGATISGKVDGADAPGTGLANVNVSVQSDTGYSGSASTDADGDYSIDGLGAGSYTVDFQPSEGNYLEQYWNGESATSQPDTLAVATGATEAGIDARLAVGSTISGTVYEAGSPATPLAGASVSVDVAGPATGTATTDADGHYTISSLPAGSYTVLFQPPSGDSDAAQYWQDAATSALATPVSVTPTTPAGGIDATLSAGATISGRVFAPGTPKTGLANTLVSIFPAAGGQPILAGGYTNKRGVYSITGVPAGSYTIGFVPQQGSGAAREWWGGSFIQTGAKTLAVTSGQSVAGISQQLIAGIDVSGTVTAGSPAAPEANVDVQIFDSDQLVGSNSFPPFETLTDSSGNYSFPEMAPGRYTVFFGPGDNRLAEQWWSGKTSQAKANYVVVKKGVPTTGVNVALVPVVIVPGTPTISGKAQVGTTLTAHPGSWKPSNIIFTYQWLRGGAVIARATASTYVPTSADVGQTLSVSVTGEVPAFEEQGLTQTVTSSSTGKVKVAP